MFQAKGFPDKNRKLKVHLKAKNMYACESSEILLYADLDVSFAINDRNIFPKSALLFFDQCIACTYSFSQISYLSYIFSKLAQRSLRVKILLPILKLCSVIRMPLKFTQQMPWVIQKNFTNQMENPKGRNGGKGDVTFSGAGSVQHCCCLLFCISVFWGSSPC